MVQLLKGSYDKEGRVVVYGQPQYFRPATSPASKVVRAVIYLLDRYAQTCDVNGPKNLQHITRALEDIEVQRKGFTVLIDGENSKYAHFDPKLPQALIESIVSRYPGIFLFLVFFNNPKVNPLAARIGYIILTNAPWFFRLIWAGTTSSYRALSDHR